MAIEVFSASLFLWPVQSLGELNPGNGVDKRFELVIRQIRAEALKPLSYLNRIIRITQTSISISR